MKYHPEQDGITHINVYSKGKTELGRLLSNFSKSPIETEDGHFESIEGYWYWLSVSETEPRRDELRNAWGFQAKALGRSLRGKDWVNTPEFKEKICKAIRLKIANNTNLQKLLIESTLPLAHYYVFSGKVIQVTSGQWILAEIESISQLLKLEKALDPTPYDDLPDDELPGMWSRTDFTGGKED